jgi:hypothetical protein
MNEHLEHFLLVFDHAAGHLVRRVEFGRDSEAAVAAYAAMEQEYTGQPSIEIVLIGSDSLATVELTHANYFDGSVAVSKYLVGLNPGF